MSADKRRKPGEQVSPRPKPAPRMVKSPEARPARVPEPDLARALEDLKRRYREWGVWEERDEAARTRLSEERR